MMLDEATEHWGIMVERVEMWVANGLVVSKKLFCLYVCQPVLQTVRRAV